MDDIERAIIVLDQQRLNFLEDYVDFAGVNDAYSLAVTALREKQERETNGGWISVKDRLPEDITDVLAYSDRNGGEHAIMWNSKRGSRPHWVRGGGLVCENVTHWQPLPAPPKE